MKRVSFNEGWTVRKVGPTRGTWAVGKVQRADIEQAMYESMNPKHSKTTTPLPAGAVTDEALAFANGAPAKVTLPHDAMLHDLRDPRSPGGGACSYFIPGAYEYVKSFDVPADWKERHVQLNFGGVYRNATVALNGTVVATHKYGYSPFTVDLDPYLTYGATNVVTVLADNTAMPNTRWYSGVGIYRNVWLETGPKTYIAHNGVKVTTLSLYPATIQVTTEVVGQMCGTSGVVSETTNDEKEGTACCTSTESGFAAQPTPTVVTVEILRDNTVIATAEGTDVTLTIPDAKLWSAETPELYTARVSAGEDTLTTTFGIRKVAVDRDGFYINGKKTLLKGACVHHDNGLLGGCSIAEAEERRMRILKENGFNAVRCAHNHASEELIAAADAVGMYIMDETWDMWYTQKNMYDFHSDFADCWQEDVDALMNNDYNHPSVVMYSIGNELSEPYDEKGIQTAQKIMEYIKATDTTRPVTAGINLLILAGAYIGINTYGEEGMGIGEATDAQGNTKSTVLTGSLLFNTIYQKVGFAMNEAARFPVVDHAISPFSDTLDIAGYNYGSGRYKADLKKHKNRVIVGAETLPPDIYKNWKLCEENPALIGDFMWAGWDYMGEAGVGTWNYEGTNVMNATYPWVLAGSGVIDLPGYPGAAAKYASTVWNNETKPYIGVRPVNHPGAHMAKSAWRGTNAFDSWSWKDCDGNPATVEVYDKHAAFIKLKLNGKLVGVKPLSQCKALFKVKYEPGTLEATACDTLGRTLGTASLTSAMDDLTLKLTPETTTARPSGVVYINLTLEDPSGTVESNADTKLSVTVENGELLGLGNANAKNPESYCADSCTTYYGRAQCIVRVGSAGTCTVTATAADGTVAKVAVLVQEP